jgi:hypothetical protein
MAPLPLRFLAALALATIGTGAFAAEITFWESPGYRSRSYASNQTIPNFADAGFNDRASSVVIRSGTWQLCSDAYFRGRCVTLGAGEYPTLASMGLDNAVSSAREMGGWPGGGGADGDRVVLFDGNGFSGRSYDVNGTIVDFAGRGFNDQARSMIIYQGAWELCQHGQFGGYCQTYGPGRYAGLGRLSGEISSIRPAGGGGGGGWGGGARAILYEGPDLTGRSFVISNQVMANLDGAGFNDRASSLRIEGGYWIFCSDAQFNGECQTFGPGDYPRLSWGLENRISSGRRIHSYYPYNTTPNWSAPR